MAIKTKALVAIFLAELLGTFILVIIGDGSIATYVLRRKPVNPFAVCLSFGVGAMLASIIAARISGAHINPAGSLASALTGELAWIMVPVYWVAQYSGAFLATVLLFLNNLEGIKSLDQGNHVGSPRLSSLATGQIFTTFPASYSTTLGFFFDSCLSTAVLFVCLSAIQDTRNSGLERCHKPVAILFAIFGICLSFNLNCSAILNPARDVATRLAITVLGYQLAWEEPYYWLLAGLVGPHLGAIVGVYTYKFFIGYWVNHSVDRYDIEATRTGRTQKASSEHNTQSGR